MKILYVASDQTLSRHHGGTIHVRSVAEELVRNGNVVHLVFQKAGDNKISPNSHLHLHPISKRNRFFLWKAGPEIQSIMSEVNPDVVLERYYNFAGEAIIRAQQSGIPAVLEVNSPMIEYPGSFKTMLDPLVGGRISRRRNRIGNSASMILVPMKEIIPAEFQNKVREIEWGVDTDKFDPSILPDRNNLRVDRGFDQDDILLIHFGSLRKWHGVPKLLKAFGLARSQSERKLQLIIAGPGAPHKSEGIHFLGEVAHSDLPGWLKMSDLAVFPFAPEKHPYLMLGFYWSPLKLFEAMAMELPLITLQHQRLVRMVGNEDAGFYFDGSIENLARKIAGMVNNLEQYRKLAKDFRRRVLENYSWQKHARKLNCWLEEVRKR